MDTMGQRIRTMREEKGWTQSRLAGVVGIKRATLGNYETGRTRPTTKILKKIAIALGTQPINLDPDLEPEFNSKGIAQADHIQLREIDQLILRKLVALPPADAGKVYTYVCEMEDTRKAQTAREAQAAFDRDARSNRKKTALPLGPDIEPDPPASSAFLRAAETPSEYGRK